MEANVCDVNHLDSDVLLPPRKRLLACLKKQNNDTNGNSYSQSECNSLNELDSRISYLLKPYLNNNNPSQEEIVAASRAAAEVAVKTAMAARAAADEKAVIAAKAMAAAKKALELVATVDDDDNDDHEISSSAEQQLKKNKMKKQVEVQMLYNNKKPRLEISKTNDEELARKLHQAINSSPRISKCGVPVPSDVKIHKHKKLKSSSIIETGGISNGNIVGEKISSKSKVENGDDDNGTIGRKRGRMKQKKLPLSIFNDRDQSTQEKDCSSRSPLCVGPSSSNVVEQKSSWKCKAFKAPVCVKQNKVMQS